MFANFLSWTTRYKPNVAHPLAPLFEEPHANDILTHVATFLDGYDVNVFARINTNTANWLNLYKEQIYQDLLRQEYKIEKRGTSSELFSLYFMKKRFLKSKWTTTEKVDTVTIPIKTKTKPKDVPMSSCTFLKKSPRKISRYSSLSEDERWLHEVLTNNTAYILFSHFHDGSFHLLNTRTKKIERTYAGHTSSVLDIQLMCHNSSTIATSPVGLGQQLNTQSVNTSSSLFNDRIISASNDKTVRVWNMMNGVCMSVMTGHTSAIYSVRCTNDLKRAVTASHDKSIRLWEIQTGVCLQVFDQAHENIIYSLRFDGESTIASCSKDGSIKLWKLQEDEIQETYKYEVKDADNANALVPIYCMDMYENMIAFGDKMGTVRFMNVKTKEIVQEHVGQGEQSSSARIILDAVKCVVAGTDNIIRVYDATTKTLVRSGVSTNEAVSLTNNFCMAVGENPHVDDQYLVSADATGNICILNF
jgi:WD40 repeat protein